MKESMPERTSQQVEIRLSGRFDFSRYREFRDAYRRTDGSCCRYLVDLEAVEYMDSAALGMLLLLRRHAGDTPDRIVLHRPRADVLRLLQTAGLTDLFRVEVTPAIGTLTA